LPHVACRAASARAHDAAFAIGLRDRSRRRTAASAPAPARSVLVGAVLSRSSPRARLTVRLHAIHVSPSQSMEAPVRAMHAKDQLVELKQRIVRFDAGRIGANASRTNPAPAPGLKILVSVVRFRPGPPRTMSNKTPPSGGVFVRGIRSPRVRSISSLSSPSLKPWTTGPIVHSDGPTSSMAGRRAPSTPSAFDHLLGTIVTKLNPGRSAGHNEEIDEGRNSFGALPIALQFAEQLRHADHLTASLLNAT